VTIVRKLMQCAGVSMSAAIPPAARDVHAVAAAFLSLCGVAEALGLVRLGRASGLVDLAPRHSAAGRLRPHDRGHAGDRRRRAGDCADAARRFGPPQPPASAGREPLPGGRCATAATRHP
jgi:hypothetical protein